jgi:hypothetical protein
MARYFIEAKKVLPLDNKYRLFIGPFEHKLKAMDELGKAMKKVQYEIVVNPDQLPNRPDSVMMQIVSKTSAVRAGMKKSHNIIPIHIDEFIEKVEKEKIEEEEIESKDAGNYLIVSKFPSTTKWLEEHGITGEVVTRATPASVKNKKVVGQVPFRLGAMAKEVMVIDLPHLKPELLGKELTTSDLDDAGANIQSYKIIKLDVSWRKIFEFLDNVDNFDQVLALTIK